MNLNVVIPDHERNHRTSGHSLQSLCHFGLHLRPLVKPWPVKEQMQPTTHIAEPVFYLIIYDLAS